MYGLIYEDLCCLAQQVFIIIWALRNPNHHNCLCLVPAATNFLCAFYYFVLCPQLHSDQKLCFKTKGKSKAGDLFQRLLLMPVSLLQKHLRIPAFIGLVESMCVLHLSVVLFLNRSAKAVIML